MTSTTSAQQQLNWPAAADATTFAIWPGQWRLRPEKRSTCPNVPISRCWPSVIHRIQWLVEEISFDTPRVLLHFFFGCHHIRIFHVCERPTFNIFCSLFLDFFEAFSVLWIFKSRRRWRFIHKSVSCMKYSLINKKPREKPQQQAAEAQFHSFERPLNNAGVFRFGLICAPEICHHHIGTSPQYLHN